MRRVLTLLAFLAGVTTANAGTVSLERLLDPLGLFSQSRMQGLLDDTSAPGSRHLFAKDGTRGGGGFLGPVKSRGGGQVLRSK